MPKNSPNRSVPARAVLGPVLRRQVAAFRAREALVRLDEPDSVRRFLVSARRLDSLLATFGTLLGPATCAALEAGLRDTADALGGAHDAEVVRRRVESLLRAEPDSRAVVNVRDQLSYVLERSYRESWQRTIDHFDSPAYDAFTRALDMFADLPPWTPAADVSARRVLVPALAQEWATLLTEGRRAQELGTGPKRDRRLHAAHDAAKRAKDVAEAQAAISGRRVERLRKAARRLATPLGGHHDSVVTGAFLSRADGDLEGADGVIPRLQARENAAASRLYDEFVRSFRDADRKSLRSWMS